MPPVKTKDLVRRRRYTDEDMHKAILAVRGGESIAGASRQYGVPRITLMDKLAGRTPEMCKMGRRPTLGEEEEDMLKKWILHCKSVGFPVSIDQLIYSTQQMLKKLGKEDIFKTGAPSKRWVEGFLKRHPELSLREGQNLTVTRANVTIEKIEQWFLEVRTYFQDNDLEDVLKDPSRVYNCDETAFFLCPAKGKVIVGRGDKAVYKVSGNNEKENITVLLNCSADGKLAPSMVVFPYDRWPPRVIASIPDEWGAGKTESGWMTSQSFYEYIGNVFDPYLTKNNIARPVVLFMDGHASHMTLEVSQLCSEKNIVLIALYPNATHILQPLDVAVFHPLKAAWRREVTQWKFENGGRKLRNEDFAPLVKKVLDGGAIKPETIANGFKSCGLLTLDPKDLNKTKIIGQPVKTSSVAAKEGLFTLQRHMYFIESRIPPASLTAFNNEENVSVEDKSLFFLWKGIRTEIDNLKKTSPLNSETINQPATTEPTDHVTESPLLEEASTPENDVVYEIAEEVLFEEASGPATAVECEAGDEIFHQEPIILEIPSDLASGPVSPPLDMDFILSANPSESDVDNLPTCSWNESLFVNETLSEITFTPTTPHSKSIIEIETPSRGFQSSPSEAMKTGLTPELTEYAEKTKQSPAKRNECNAPSNIPSPFKNCLLWPNEKPKPNMKRNKIRTPSVVTSKLWKDYHQKLKDEKTKKDMEVAERKLKREEKKKQQSENKKRKIEAKEREEEKEEGEEDEEEALEEDCNDEKESFDLQKCCEAPNLPPIFKVGLWVVVPYPKQKGGTEQFVGQILTINEEEASVEVKFTVKKGEKYVWPIQDDIDTVIIQDIITVLDEPFFDRRGYLSFTNPKVRF